MFWRQNFFDFNQGETSCVWKYFCVSHKVMAALATTTRREEATVAQRQPANNTASAATAATSATMKRRAHSSSFNGVPLILIINYLLLLLLMLCCDVCKSNEYLSTSSPLTSSSSSSLSSLSSSMATKSSAPTTTPTVANEASIIDQINLNATIFKHVAQNGVDAAAAAADIDSIASAEKNTAEIVSNVNETCMQRCSNEVDTFLDEFGIKCAAGDVAEKCFATRCSKGCQHWWRALQEFEPCQEACSSLQFFPFDLPCITACEMAQRDYWHLQRLAMAPIINSIRTQLLNDSSLMLQWPIKLPLKFLASRPFNIQYSIANNISERYEQQKVRHAADFQNLTSFVEETHHADWSNLADYNCNDNFNCDILDGLMPYTSYRFRFELPFGESVADVLHSPATDVYKTAQEGAPLSRPAMQNVLALDESHIALYWQPGEFTNGPLKAYKLLLQEVKTNVTLEQSIPADQYQFIIADLKPRSNYTLRLSMLNAEGAGPEAQISIMTKDLPQTSTEEMNLSKLILVGEYSIQLKSLEPLTETRLVYRSDELISDYAILLETQRIFVIDAAGGLFSAHLSEPNEREALFLNMSAGSFKPAKLAVDWLNLKLYIAAEASNKTWFIARTDLEGNRLEILSTTSNQPIKQLEVDPINGWLFWLTETGLKRFNLATKKPTIITKKSSFTSFMLDFARNLLIVYDKNEQELYELSFDGSFEHKLGANNSKLLQGLWKSFFYSHNTRNIYATNGTHLLHLNNGTHANDVWFIRELEWCWNILPMQLQQTNELQPQPQPQGSPSGVQALLTANMAKISWQAPALLAHQTPDAWQQWEYELELMDVASNSAFNIRNIKSSYFDVEQLQANNLYKLRVRAAGKQSTLFGDWSSGLLTRTWPRGQHKLLWASSEGFYETNELGKQPELLLELQSSNATLNSFVQLNGTIFYVLNNTLHCANIMNPELNCSFNVATAIRETSIGCVAYDWRGAKIYWTDLRRNVVLRASLDGSMPELLPIFDALQIAIDSYAGHIYYSTGTRLARRMLSGRAESEAMIEVEYYHVNGFGGVIRGFTLDLMQQQLYWVVRQNEGHVRLFKANMTQHAEHKLEDVLLESDILEGSLEFVPDIDSLVWLQAGMAASSQLIFARSDNFSSQAVLEVPHAMRHVYSVHLKVPYTPYQDASVIPDAVDAESIRIEEDGYWDDFNVKWSPVAAADNYSVHYKVLLQYNDESAQLSRFYTLTVAEPLLHLNDFQRPKLMLNISITPHTAWQAGATVSTQLHTPAEAPTQPKRLRVFIRNTAQPMQTMPNISAHIRWDPPENVSANTAVAYKAYCWLGTELIAERVHNASSDQILETSVGELVEGETYTFQVQAFAAGRRSGGERTAFQAVHIHPEVQAVPMLLYATSEFIAELDMDLDRRRILVHTASEVEHLSLMQGEQRLLWVNDNVELLTYVPGAATVKLARMRAEVLALTTDWISRRVYWAELDNDAVSIYELDLCRYEGRIMTGTKLFTTESGKLITQLVMLPFAQTLLWLEHAVGEQNAVLAGRNLTDGSALQLKGATFRRMFEGSLSAEMETVNLVDQQGQVCAFDVHRQLCNSLKLHFNVATDVAAIERDNGYIYMLHNGSMRAYDRRKQHLEFQLEVPDVRKIKAYNYQPYPARQCLLPEVDPEFPQYASEPLKPNVTELAERYFTLELPELPLAETCWLPIPGVRYLLTILDDQQEPKLNVTLFERNVNVTQLHAYTNYTIELRVATYYQQRLALPQLHIPDTIVGTAVGTPSAAQNFTARPLSPIEIEVNWLEPTELNSARVWYELHWQMQNASLGAHKTLEEANTLVVLTNLLPSTQYTLWLQVHSTANKFNVSQTLAVQTFEQPRDLQLLAAAAYNLTLSWQSTTDVSSTFLACQALSPGSEEDENEFSIDITNKSSQITITDLRPRTRYEFHLELNYANVLRPYRWPDTALQSFIYETLSDRPGSPGRPQIEHITGEIFKVFWEPAVSNGAPIIEYSMEALQSRSPTLKRIRRHDVSSENQMYANQTIAWLSQLPWAEEPQALEDKWVAICNTTELSCIIRETHTLRLLMFRVRARNEPHGWGPYSEDSDRVSEPYVSPEKRNSLVIAIIAPAVIVSSCVLLLIVFRAIQNRRVRNKKLLEKSRPSIWSNFSTIQQQQLMASRYRAFSVASHTTMYTGGPLSDADIALLPHISWNQITLLNFLGSGAFGEVYEGLVKHEDEEEPEKVAIKSLRKGASEFAELLKEAQLMSNFKHENIVRLIGVCCDTESISIIMEHMEAGDLLSYLRESRPNATRPMPTLQILDTMTMCIDVATGCCYLEDMHFVHRDLACRNCLVSSRERSKRVVKIGDFGLARDIYKNDYYRKEGEGLLPVRWMSPESLVDGVFSTQSDVWAFGVLCWEILTLGQQPYAARNNLDVLQYVKAGGRLEQPENCPDKLFALMLQCWKSVPEERPTFRQCLNVLLAVKSEEQRNSKDDDDAYVMYANNQSIVLSTFLANPLPKTDNDEDMEQAAIAVDPVLTRTMERNANEKATEMKVRFNGCFKEEEEEIESLNDDVSQLIVVNGVGTGDDELNYYTNEAVSRL